MGEAIPPGSDEDIREKLERDFDLELQAVRNLDALSDRLIARWAEQAGNRNAADRILTLSIARGTTTFKACQRLVLGGFGREAMMLNRSMFEGMAVAHWVAANPELAAPRFDEANEFEIFLLRKRIANEAPDLPQPKGPGELTDEEADAAAKKFGRNNERLWTGHRNIWELVDDIEDQWEESGKTALRVYLRDEHQRNTKQMHASASALADLTLDSLTPRGDRTGMTVRLGPGPEELDGALLGAFFIQANLLSLLVSHYELGADAEAQVELITTENQFAFAVIDPDATKNTGRNDPCPCGSGKKFKNCHWDRARLS
jgi:hypothetical protein